MRSTVRRRCAGIGATVHESPSDLTEADEGSLSQSLNALEEFN